MGKTLQIRITDAVEKDLQKVAVSEGKTVSELVREILENFLSGDDRKISGSDAEILDLVQKNFRYQRTLAKLILDIDLRTYAMRSGLTVADKMQLDAEIQKRKKVFVEKLEKIAEGGGDV
ncbi:hypothetical protein LFML04_0587 [Leptospirillum ferriphilum ML-04]|jgi:mRNA-degrading endonuclease RelE of RelBE toxin-antitoxin system|uniref:Uncharacterized protein n=1 Tax=Leptospirillum ferriphilum (strain ML-04) TaxID=1048260 RepID=J9ZAF9_LEPFM|nr:hypothetical protein LFML04_0587 [Leptospirillum ferriphilum ML-04]